MIFIGDFIEFEKMIGKKILSIDSSMQLANAIYDGEVNLLDLNICLNYEGGSITIHKNGDLGFFEDKHGNVFYDYAISKEKFSYTSRVAIKTSEVVGIKVLGREFKWEDIPNSYMIGGGIKDEGIIQTTDAFKIMCTDGAFVFIVYHPFFPELQIIYTEQAYNSFMEEYGYLYKYINSLPKSD